jgi:hypothetical protein
MGRKQTSKICRRTSEVRVALALPPSLERTEKEDADYHYVDSGKYPKALRVL